MKNRIITNTDNENIIKNILHSSKISLILQERIREAVMKKNSKLSPQRIDINEKRRLQSLVFGTPNLEHLDYLSKGMSIADAYVYDYMQHGRIIPTNPHPSAMGG